MKCSFCEIEMEGHNHNNPEPLLESSQRVCSDCNCLVTAFRVLSRQQNQEIVPELAKFVGSVIQLSNSLKRANAALSSRAQTFVNYSEDSE